VVDESHNGSKGSQFVQKMTDVQSYFGRDVKVSVQRSGPSFTRVAVDRTSFILFTIVPHGFCLVLRSTCRNGVSGISVSETFNIMQSKFANLQLQSNNPQRS